MPQEGDEKMAEARPHMELVDEGEGRRKSADVKDPAKDEAKGGKLPVGGQADHMIKDFIEEKGLAGPAKMIMETLKDIELPIEPTKIVEKLKEFVPKSLINVVFPNGGGNMMDEIKKILKTPDPPAVLVEVAEGQDAAPEGAEGAAAAAAEKAKAVLKVGGPKDLAIKELIMRKLEDSGGKAMMDTLKYLGLPTDAAAIEKKLENVLPMKELNKVIPPEAKEAVKNKINSILKMFGGFR